MQHRDIATGNVHVPFNWIVADAPGLAALAPVAGDLNKIAYQVDVNQSYVLSSVTPVTWTQLTGTNPTGVRGVLLAGLSTVTNAAITAADTVLGAFGKLQKQITDALASLNSHTGSTLNPHNTTAAQVGLSNVNNTSDANKPISTATQAALDLKSSISGPTGTLSLPHGTQAQRAVPASGRGLRWNDDTASLEAYDGAAWGGVGAGGGAAVPGSPRNLLLNPEFLHDIRNDFGQYSIPAGIHYLCDKWRANVAQGGKLTSQIFTGGPPGTGSQMWIQVATQYAPAAAEKFVVEQPIEGSMIARLGWGAAGPQYAISQLWIKGSVVGTYAVSLSNFDGSRTWVGLMNIAAANTWTQPVITITGCTDGTWKVLDYQLGLIFRIDLGSGSNYNALLPAPVVNAPTTAATGGSLAAATYFYKVTALNAAGETVGSNEVSQATTGATSTVSLSWAAIAGATSYRVYRGTATGAQSVFYAPGNVTSYTDTGAASTAGTVPVTNTASTANTSWNVSDKTRTAACVSLVNQAAGAYLSFSATQLEPGQTAYPIERLYTSEQRMLLDRYCRLNRLCMGFAFDANTAVVSEGFDRPVMQIQATIIKTSAPTLKQAAFGTAKVGSGSTMAGYESLSVHGMSSKINGFTGLTVGGLLTFDGGQFYYDADFQ